MRKIDERSQCTEQADVPRSVSSVIGVPRKLNMKLVRPAELTEAVSYQLILSRIFKAGFAHSACTLGFFYLLDSNLSMSVLINWWKTAFVDTQVHHSKHLLCSLEDSWHLFHPCVLPPWYVEVCSAQRSKYSNGITLSRRRWGRF